ncbi:MAG: YihY/virulence factor BrkB family protein [Ferruginibacter sp.]
MTQPQDAKPSALQLTVSSIIPSLKMLRNNDPLRMAGATAFFTTFAMPPIVFILAQLFGLVIGSREMGRGLIENIGNNLGNEGAQQVRQVIRSILGFSHKWYVIVPGFVFLFFIATTLFIVIKSSLDQIWRVTIKDKPGILFNIGERLKSFAVILLTGILFFANLIFKSLETFSGKYVDNIFNGGSFIFKIIFSEITSVIIVSAWFVILFRFLADTRPGWKPAIIGGIFTAVLFTGGRFLLKMLLINSNIGILYGPSGSMVLVLLFVFYTSFIMYYGACFIAVYSDKAGLILRPDKNAYANSEKH